MEILLLKILLAPLVITLCTLLARKYGHSIGGLLIGLPLTSGPVAFILTLQNGAPFVAEFSNGILLGISLLALFNFVYAYASKSLHWAACILSGWTAFSIAAYFLDPLHLPAGLAFTVVVFSLVVSLYFFPSHQKENHSLKSAKWDIPVRVCTAAGMIFLVTSLSERLGPHLSGIVSTLPVYATIFSASTHYHYGSNASIELQKGILSGSFSFAVFFVILGTTVLPMGTSLSFFCAAIGALLVQVGLYQVRRYTSLA